MTPYFDDGAVTIYHGDCRDFVEVEHDSVVTDPPYGIGFAAQPTKWQRRAGAEPKSWDDRVASDVVEGLAASEKPTIIWGGNYYSLSPQRGWLIWTKPDAPPSMGSAEMAWTNLAQCARVLSVSIGQTNAERVGHPTQKPLRVMTWSLSFIATPGVVLDPFMGSGTTLRACKDLGIRAVGIEIDERYCEMAVRRLAQQSLFTTKVAP